MSIRILSQSALPGPPGPAGPAGPQGPAGPSASLPPRLLTKVAERASLRDFGVVGDLAADDTAAVQAAFDALPDYALLEVPPGCRAKITAPITLTHRVGLRVTGLGTNSADGGQGFYWGGSDGGVMFRLRNCRDCVFEQFSIVGRASGNANGADVGFDLDQDLGLSGITSNIEFSHVTIAANAARATWVGIRIAETSGNNCEFIRCHNCLFYCGNSGDPQDANQGVAVKMNSANAKGIGLDDCEIVGARIGVWCANGSFAAHRVHGYGVGTVYRVDNATDPIVIRHGIWERTTRFAKLPPGGTVEIASCSFADDVGGDVGSEGNPWIDASGCVLTLTGNEWDANGWPYPVKGDINATLIALGNRWNSSLYRVGLTTFREALVVDRDGTTFASRNEGRGGELRTLMPGGFSRRLIGAGVDSLNVTLGLQVGAPGQPQLGDGEVEVRGIAQAMVPTVDVVGTNGNRGRVFALVAKDATGRRSLRSPQIAIYNVPSVLSVSGLLHFTWTAVPGAACYDLLQQNPSDNGQWRLVATVAGGSYDLSWESTAAFDYALPHVNETGGALVRGPLVLQGAAPADGDLVAGQVALWLDETAGATKLKVKAKDAAGAVRTGEVVLS